MTPIYMVFNGAERIRYTTRKEAEALHDTLTAAHNNIIAAGKAHDVAKARFPLTKVTTDKNGNEVWSPVDIAP